MNRCDIRRAVNENLPSSHRRQTVGRSLFIGIFIVALPSAAVAAPEPGEVFREYRWTNKGGDAGGSLRVGGRLDYGGGPIELAHDFDLAHATRVEVVVEKLLCHDGTRGLSISVNDYAWIEFPEADDIPAPQWDYQHHTYPVVVVPLDQLRAGTGNQFRMKVSDEHSWRWPQNLIYGVHFRIYYDAKQKPHPTGRLVSPCKGAKLGTEVELRAEAPSPNGRIARVDFLGRFEDVNLEGDGLYTQWHYHYVRSQLTGHIGSATEAPWSLTWDTSWISDQRQRFQLAAWITDETGLTLFTEVVDGLTFDRGGLSVELCKPFDVPMKWVTRKGEHEQGFRIHGDLSKAAAARLVWCSWSPGYMEGVYINDRKMTCEDDPGGRWREGRVGRASGRRRTASYTRRQSTDASFAWVRPKCFSLFHFPFSITRRLLMSINTRSCPDCERGLYDRRGFLRITAAGAASVAASGFVRDAISAESPSTDAPETLVKRLYDSLSDKQKRTVTFDWDHQDAHRGLLRTRVGANWHITEPAINSDFYTAEQQRMMREIFDGIIQPDWHARFDKQMQDDTNGFGNDQNIAIFGKPGDGKFEFVLTGRHMTLRCDGNSAEHVAFGGPIFYGHAADGFTEKPNHPGNVFWEQALAANAVHEMLDGKQRKLAQVARSPKENQVAFRGSDGQLPGIPVAEMSTDQREQVQKTLQKLIEPYRQSDRDEVVACLKAQGGLDQCHLAFYTDKDLGDDGVWDNWRLEGPAFVWYFRGSPHVHTWVNVADDPSVELNA